MVGKVRRSAYRQPVTSDGLRKIEQGKFDLLNDNIEFFHLGKCLRCGKTLTDQESINIGLGPVCRS